MPGRLELERKQVKHVGQLCFGVVLGSNLWVVIPCFCGQYCGHHSLHVQVDHLEYNKLPTHCHQPDMSMDPLVRTNIISRLCPGTPVVIILQRGPFSLSGRMIHAWSLPSMQCHPTFGLLSHSGTRSILACNGDAQYAGIVGLPRSWALCCPVHAFNLEGPGTLVPAFYLATSCTSSTSEARWHQIAAPATDLRFYRRS